ncbi:L-aspartate oxidase [Auraticoccus monumenti]|uniref:L-aspartate oxidase n=1 Tax=Auraticoccus monumenti TaxID=675864 RepID=A0A1G6V1G8_9ACTN|nr:FAD-dependent oxidoreductase [Auraticoccus monumenti]SDD47388.1 L-aspartate oxidase [Auraticoccus monumenti]
MSAVDRRPHLVVVGSGVAGLTAALEAATSHRVTLLTKADLDQSNTRYAQGGIAVVHTAEDSVAAHVRDTLVAGAGLSDVGAVEVLCGEGPDAVLAMLGRGVGFDRLGSAGHFTGAAASGPGDGAERGTEGTAAPAALRPGDGAVHDPWAGLAHGLEAAHSAARILHAGGDATGAAIVSALLARLTASPVVVRARTTVGDLLVEDGVVVGVRLLDGEELRADAVLLATGGAGQLYPFTTNPAVATADGVALALRAGAVVSDLEMYQFHPTSLDAPGSFLVSEAVRGEGAVLRDADGYRFMTDVHPDAELAPRDVVARGIATQMARHPGRPVVLDATALGSAFLARRFPTIDAACRRLGFDWGREPIPVTPAAHYAMGGVRTDGWGRTSLPGLLAVGEVACTGLHGANRLASNSLLEGAVFATRAVRGLRDGAPAEPWDAGWAEPAPFTVTERPDAVLPTRADLQQLLWRSAGLVRDRAGLEEAADVLAGWRSPEATDAKSAEDANLVLVGRALVAAATARTESRGSHHRRDFPSPDSTQAVHRSLVLDEAPAGRGGHPARRRPASEPTVGLADRFRPAPVARSPR